MASEISKAVLGATLVVVGAPIWGQDYGGALALGPTTVLWWLLARGKSIRVRTVLVIGGVLVATGVIWFMVGHPLGFMSFPVANMMTPFDWLTNRDLAPRIFDDACLAFIEPVRNGTGANTYTGRIHATSTSS